LIKHLEEHLLQSNMNRDDILMYYTTVCVCLAAQIYICKSSFVCVCVWVRAHTFIIIIINAKCHETAIHKVPHPLYRTRAVLDSIQMSNNFWIYVSFVYFQGCKDGARTGRMPVLAPTLDFADPLCALVIAPCFYLHHVELFLEIYLLTRRWVLGEQMLKYVEFRLAGCPLLRGGYALSWGGLCPLGGGGGWFAPIF